ncbi:MAG: glycosyltransferase family 2 protein [Candidatus Omnitrophica bacterium]|nr:glycosyltransferase family 2 protein [Candidatus Omnitrophota bacterium]
MNSVPITVVIIAKNEERNLPDCLRSISWAKEIIVVDGGSKDKTVEIARSYGAKVLHREMDIEGRHRNFAYAQATQDWILSLDADERVSPELASEIATVIKENDPGIAGYAIPIKTFIGNRWIKAAGYYPARKLRMHRRGKFRYEETGVHPRAFLEGKERPLRGDILHYGLRDFAHFIEKLNNQTTLEAQKWIQDGRRITWFKAIYKSWDRFLRNYIGKKGYSDGFLGFMMSVFHGLYQLFSYAKYAELKREKNQN